MNYMLDLPSLVQAAGDAIIAADTDGKILLAAPAKFEAESATNEMHKSVAPDGP
jgi:hypothetical protein